MPPPPDSALQPHLPSSSCSSDAASTSSTSTGSLATPPVPDSPQHIVDIWRQGKCKFLQTAIQITSDSVGYGFVVRGTGPTYVHIVDPLGPAAKAGLKVGQIIQAVNGVPVLDLDNRQVSRLIIGDRVDSVLLQVIEPAAT